MIMWVLVALAALAASPVMPVGSAAEADGDFSPMNSRNYPLELTARITKPTCVDIPSDLSLCQNIGYSQMRMPNLLDHDTMEEVKHQAQSWVPLLMQRCHAETQLFLCTLFAPVCLDRPIYPCRSLCEEVRGGCAPVMESNCFPWPAMLECSKFPPDNDLCIKSDMRDQNGTATSPTFEISPVLGERYMTLFTQCRNDSTPEVLRQKFCTSDFVLKMKFKKVRTSKTDGKKYLGDTNPKKMEVLKQGSLKNKDLKRLTFYVREGANCRCDMLENSRNYQLIMGHRDRNNPKKLFIHFVHSWEKTRDFRRAIKSFEDPDVCADLAAMTENASDGRRHDPTVDADASDLDAVEADDPQAAGTQNAQTDSVTELTNAPPREGVPTNAEQVMSDETPPTPRRRKNGARRGRRRERGGRDRERNGPRKSRARRERYVPVKSGGQF
ncbi:secreted frizzled-related protein 5-like [Diadema setosum]|uniref:secreted frizzled-related protein 5-like n=1 Tax=Diadema setosum TaxID=31175 RepID=UPI003B3AED80